MTDLCPFVIVAAVARNGIIGDGNRLPWNLPSDLKHFRALTLGRPLLMGRKTFASIGRPLPGRQTIVLTRDAGFAPQGVHVVHSLEEALAMAQALARAMAAPEWILAGGAELYAALLPRATRLHITHVDLAPNGDAVFPAIDPQLWHATSRVAPPRDARDEADFIFATYHRFTLPATAPIANPAINTI